MHSIDKARFSRVEYLLGLLESKGASGGGGGGVVPQASWTVPDWYINGATGSDSNSGTDPAHPIKTINGGIVEKWQTTSPILAQATTFHLQASDTSAAQTISPIMVGPNNLIIMGTPTLIASFAAGTVTAKVQTATGNALKVAGFTAPGLAPAQVVHNVTRNSYAMIDSITTGVATMQQPFTASSFTVSAVPTLTQDDTWTTGDALQVLSLPSIANPILFNPRGGNSDPSFTTGTCWAQFVHVPDPSGTPGVSTFLPLAQGCGIVFALCSFDAFFQFDGSQQGYGAYSIACSATGGSHLNFALMIGGGSNVAANESTEFENICTVDGNAILHGDTLIKGAYTAVGEVHVADGTFICAHGGVALLETTQAVTNTTSLLWGPCVVNLEGPDSAVHNDTGSTWASCLNVTSMFIDGAGIGWTPPYSGGTFTLNGVTQVVVPGAPGPFPATAPIAWTLETAGTAPGTGAPYFSAAATTGQFSVKSPTVGCNDVYAFQALAAPVTISIANLDAYTTLTSPISGSKFSKSGP